MILIRSYLAMPAEGNEDQALAPLSSPVSALTPGVQDDNGLSIPGSSKEEPAATCPENVGSQNPRKSQALLQINRQEIQSVDHISQAAELQGGSGCVWPGCSRARCVAAGGQGHSGSQPGGSQSWGRERIWVCTGWRQVNLCLLYWS